MGQVKRMNTANNMLTTNTASVPGEPIVATSRPSELVDAASRPGEPTVAIIGYGTAGVNALIALRTHGFDGRVIVFSDTNTLPYSPILTSYYAGGMKPYEAVFPWSAEELDALYAEVHSDCPVTKLDPAAHLISTPEGDFAYTKCIIASGAKAHCAGFPQFEGYAPLVLRTLDEAERLKQTLLDPACKRILISGASMIALKAAEACLNRGIDTSLVGMNPHVLDFNAFPETAERVEAALRGYGMILRLGMVIKAVRFADDGDAAKGRLEVTFSNGDVDFFDDIIVAHGVRSSLAFLEAGALELYRALVVDEHMRTSDPDVYAAGDVAQALELTSGQKRIVGIWKSAALQGACAGEAIATELAGRNVQEAAPYPGAVATNTIVIRDTLFISAGTLELGENRHTESREVEDMLIMTVVEEDEEGNRYLVGFNIACDHDERGGAAYDLGAMLTMHIEQDSKKRLS